MISLALCADAIIGNVQEKAIKSHNASNAEVVSDLYDSETRKFHVSHDSNDILIDSSFKLPMPMPYAV